ncbi:MAG: phosphatase PAP2 family protein [Alphaproteobacteria bacterium]|nr:MAG: phosphatase PAP2 family protein [Alphaproteobacteria bacterium]
MDYLLGLDLSLYRALNQFCGSSPVLDRLASDSSSVIGPFFMGIVGALWFSSEKDTTRRHQTLIIMLLAVALSLVLNRVLSTFLPFRYRPMFSVGANAPGFEWHADLENWSSFPSDNATYLFAIAGCFWLISWRAGLLFAVFATYVSLSRVYLGIHYPADVLAGAMLGITVAFAVNSEIARKLVAGRVLVLESRYRTYFYCLFFIALAEVSGGFQVTRHVGVAIVHLFVPYGDTRHHSNPQPISSLPNAR